MVPLCCRRGGAEPAWPRRRGDVDFSFAIYESHPPTHRRGIGSLKFNGEAHANTSSRPICVCGAVLPVPLWTLGNGGFFKTARKRRENGGGRGGSAGGFRVCRAVASCRDACHVTVLSFPLISRQPTRVRRFSLTLRDNGTCSSWRGTSCQLEERLCSARSFRTASS